MTKCKKCKKPVNVNAEACVIYPSYDDEKQDVVLHTACYNALARKGVDVDRWVSESN